MPICSSPSSENEAADIPGVGLSEATNCFAPAVVKGYNVVSHGGGGGGGGGDESQVGRQSHVGHAARNTSSSVSAVAELQVSWLERFCLNAAGLLHINQISQEHVKSVESILKEGDKLKVMILSYDRDQGRVALSTKVLEPTPGDMLKDPQLVNDKAEETAEAFKLRAEAFRSRAATTQVGGKAKRVPAKWDGQVMPYKIGDVVEGVVKLIKPYGAFVNLGGFDGLLHISQITRGRIFSVTHILKEGDKLKVMILSYDRDRGRITLSTKKLEPSPGDMLTNPQLVFDKAEEMAEALKSRAAETQSRTDDSTGDQMASETYVY